MAKTPRELPPVEEAIVVIEEMPPDDPVFSVTLRADNSYEYHVDLAKSLVEDIMNPQTPTRFIEVAPLSAGGTKLPGVRRFLNTLYIKEVDVRGYE